MTQEDIARATAAYNDLERIWGTLMTCSHGDDLARADALRVQMDQGVDQAMEALRRYIDWARMSVAGVRP